MSNLRGWELLVLLAVLLLLFGAKRLPDTARGLGRSLRIFKAETRGLRDDDRTDDVPPPAAGGVLPDGSPRPVVAGGESPPTPQREPLHRSGDGTTPQR
jgi:sec-independent protein translocase protein TatA